MIDQRLSHPTVVSSSRLVLLYVKTSKKRIGKGRLEGNVEIRKGLDRKGKVLGKD